MLGEKIYDITAKVSGTRVLPDEGHGLNVEVSFQGAGKLLGMEMQEIGTYRSFLRPSGSYLAEGQGISISKDGEVAKWRGFGVGKPLGKGLAASYRYSVAYETDSKKLARLNEIVLVGEWEVDENGNAKGAAFEWK